MSIQRVPMLVCDGCGTAIETDYHIRIRPTDQRVIHRDLTRSPERDFCSEACLSWWVAQFPTEGPWGPAWEERDWWCHEVGPCGERAQVRTAHEESPLVNTKVHFDRPERLARA